MDRELIIKGIRNPSQAIKYIRGKAIRSLMRSWCKRSSISDTDHMSAIDNNLWKETREYARQLENNLKNRYKGEVQTSDFNSKSGVGGSASYDLLYFYTRHLQPEIVVETGVSAGWSSRSILDALNKNEAGHLYSNDLPYLERSMIQERHDVYPDVDDVGVLVSENQKSRWELTLGPDRENLPKILSNIDSVDLVHYDSDKTYKGRKFAMEAVRDKLHSSSVVIMDDITDNTFFRDFVSKNSMEYYVIESERGGKYVGIFVGTW